VWRGFNKSNRACKELSSKKLHFHVETIAKQ
jgi:hypothetical protein